MLDIRQPIGEWRADQGRLTPTDLRQIVRDVSKPGWPDWRDEDIASLAEIVGRVYDPGSSSEPTQTQSNYERIRRIRDAVRVLIQELPGLAWEKQTAAMQAGNLSGIEPHLLLKAAHASLEAAAAVFPPLPAKPKREERWHALADIIDGHAEGAWLSVGVSDSRPADRARLVERIFQYLGESRHSRLMGTKAGAVKKHLERRQLARKSLRSSPSDKSS